MGFHGGLCSSNPTGVVASEGAAAAEGGPSLHRGIPIPGLPCWEGKAQGSPWPHSPEGNQPAHFFSFLDPSLVKILLAPRAPVT